MPSPSADHMSIFEDDLDRDEPVVILPPSTMTSLRPEPIADKCSPSISFAYAVS